MKAILIATGYQEEMAPLLRFRPTPLLKIADKPILFYIIEYLHRHGIRHIELILHHLPEQIEAALEDGQRWGITLSYHLAKNPKHPFQVITPLAQGWDPQTVLIGLGDLLPHFSESFPDALPCLYNFEDKTWTGWGILSSTKLAQVPSHALEKEIPGLLKYSCTTLNPFLSVRNFQDLKTSNLRIICQKPNVHLFPSTTRMVEKDVWISRGVTLHPSALIYPPVFIGDHSQIHENSIIGPNAVIENNCVIDRESLIENSLICQRSYIGQGLLISDGIIDKNLLINLSLETHVEITDDFILAELPPLTFPKFPLVLLESVLATAIFLLFLPIYFLMGLTSKTKKKKVLSLPASTNPHQWKMIEWVTFEPKNTFEIIFQDLPTLLLIIKGQAHFIGLNPRTFSEAEAMPPEWQKLYVQSKLGLITLCDLDNSSSTSLEQCYASELYYATNMGFKLDFQLFLRWLKKKLLAIIQKEGGHESRKI